MATCVMWAAAKGNAMFLQYVLRQFFSKLMLWLICFFITAQLVPVMAQVSPGYFPNTPLITQDGVKVLFYDDLLKGKSVAINVIYTSCTNECPLETARMAEVQRLLGERMGKDIVFYSISIDPENDTPKVLKEYASKFNVGPGWLFLTGKKEDIILLVKKLGLSRKSDEGNKDGHASSLMLGNEHTGQWMRNSAVDNPRFLVSTMNNFFNWHAVQGNKDYADARPIEISYVQFIFQSRCASCHTIGGGDKIGPDLAGIRQRREPKWLARFVKEPEKMLASGDALATQLFDRFNQVRMPNLGLTDNEVFSLLNYIDARGKEPPQMTTSKAVSDQSSGTHVGHHHD